LKIRVLSFPPSSPHFLSLDPTIPDLPQGQKPREKMALEGAASLSDDELLAIFLRTGVKGENAIAIGRRLLRNHHGLQGLARAEVPLLAKEHGLGLAKACQLAAAFELGKRLARQMMDRTPLESPEDIYQFMAPQMTSLRTESLRVLVLDNKLRCVGVSEITRGSVNQTAAFARDVIRPVLIHQEATFAVVHNHPSGDPSPSTADHQFTQELNEVCSLLELHLTDHVIIGHPDTHSSQPYYSFRESGKL